MGPFKCPDCGIWWAGFEHRCRPTEVMTGTAPLMVKPFGPFIIGGGSTSPQICTCPKDPNYVGDNLCHVHAWTIT